MAIATDAITMRAVAEVKIQYAASPEPVRGPGWCSNPPLIAAG
jgi:hypothetical protein